MHHGGVQTFLVKHAPLLLQHGVRLNFGVMTAEEEHFDAYLRSLGCPIYALPPFSRRWAYMRALSRLLRAHPEITIVHAHLNFANLWPLVAAWQAGIKIRVSHSHNNIPTHSLLRRAARRMFQSVVGRLATDYWSCSSVAGAWLYGQKLQARRGVVIPNAIATRRFAFSLEARRSIRQQLGYDESTPVWIHTGSFGGAKNQPFLLRLFALYNKEKPEARLILCGDGAARPALERQIAESGLTHCVHLAGNVDNVSDYLSAADLLLMPSLYEGFPFSTLEAQCSGLPCVVSEAVPEEALVTPCAQRLRHLELADWLAAVRRAPRLTPPQREEGCAAVAAAGYELEDAARRLAERYKALGEAREQHDE